MKTEGLFVRSVIRPDEPGRETLCAQCGKSLASAESIFVVLGARVEAVYEDRERKDAALLKRASKARGRIVMLAVCDACLPT